MKTSTGVQWFKFRCWLWVHDAFEWLWHWSYRVGVAPNTPPEPPREDVLWSSMQVFYEDGTPNLGFDTFSAERKNPEHGT